MSDTAVECGHRQSGGHGRRGAGESDGEADGDRPHGHAGNGAAAPVNR
jgi:hypothetical protein